MSHAVVSLDIFEAIMSSRKPRQDSSQITTRWNREIRLMDDQSGNKGRRVVRAVCSTASNKRLIVVVLCETKLD